jgi:hypothetical protein
MNHYSIILTAMEGDNFINGAKSAGVLYYSHITSFRLIDMVDTFYFL